MPFLSGQEIIFCAARMKEQLVPFTMGTDNICDFTVPNMTRQLPSPGPPPLPKSYLATSLGDHSHSKLNYL